jgi:hypothetical protein
MTTGGRPSKRKSRFLNRQDSQGNVSQARKATGHSRDSFYWFKTLYETGGEAALAETSGKKPNEKNRADPIVEQAAADFAYERVASGQ